MSTANKQTSYTSDVGSFYHGRSGSRLIVNNKEQQLCCLQELPEKSCNITEDKFSTALLQDLLANENLSQYWI